MENMKKLQRDTQHRVLGGVCSGLANYFGIDATLVRLIFAMALLAFSAGFWIYIILWIVMPEGDGIETQQFVEMEDGQMVQEAKSRKSSLTAGLVLIVAGICFLLGNLIPQFSWRTFWPLALIALGLLLIVPVKDRES